MAAYTTFHDDYYLRGLDTAGKFAAILQRGTTFVSCTSVYFPF